MTKVYLWLYFTTFYLFCRTKGDWVDPHSMDSNVKEKIASFSAKTHDPPNLDTAYCTHIVNCDSDLYLRRIVRLILNNAHLDKEDLMGQFSGHLDIKLSAKEYKFLSDFAQSDESREGAYSEVNSIFENAFQKTSFHQLKEMMLSFEEHLHLIVFNPTTHAVVALCLTLYVTYKLLTANFTWRSIIKYFLFFIYLADFMITYLQIVRDDEINNMVTIKKLGSIPPECDPQKLSWWQYMKTQFESALFENPCKQYYQATYQNFGHLVAPTKVLTLQFRTLVVEPIGDLGEAFGKFGRRMFTSLPWGLNIAIFPIMLITALATIFIIILFITKPHFRISVFHMFTIEMGQPAPVIPAIQRRSRRAIQEVGNNADHRALVEDTSNDSSSGQLDANQEIEIGTEDANGNASAQTAEKDENNSTVTETLGSDSH